MNRGNTIPLVTPSSAMRYDWIMPATSPCLLNRNNQYSFVVTASDSCNIRALGRGIDASTYSLYFAFFPRPVENVSDAVVRQACYLL